MIISVFDWIFVISAVIFNISILGIWISAKKNKKKLIKKIGSITISLIVPMTLVFINYMYLGRELWIMIYIIVILTYIILEILLDYIFEYDFRSKTSTHVSYIILYYAVAFGFVGVSFSIDKTSGFIVLITFWISLIGLIYLLAGKKQKGMKNII